MKKCFWTKSKSNDWFTSPKHKYIFLKIGLKSSIISKVDLPESKIFKKCSKPFLKTNNKFWGPIVHGDQFWEPFVQGDQLSLGPFVHWDQMFGDQLSRGTNCLGDHLSMGTKWAGTVCSWGPIVGDQMSGDRMGSGPNEKQPIISLIQYFYSSEINVLPI